MFWVFIFPPPRVQFRGVDDSLHGWQIGRHTHVDTAAGAFGGAPHGATNRVRNAPEGGGAT
eukprot:8857029-Pyramimonas_sp.AAC.1